jgi:hypothetical protein
MSNLSQFKGGGIRSPKVLGNYYAVAGFTANSQTTPANYQFVGCKTSTSGAMTANALKTLLSLTGAGHISNLVLSTVDATARTMRLKITIDGVVAFDYTSASITSANTGAVICGAGNSAILSGDGFYFNTSFLVEAASNLAETDKFNIITKYETF